MKRTGRCRDMHDVLCEDSPGYLATRIQRMDESGSVRRNKNNGLWKRMPCTKSRLHDQFSRQKVHSKEVRSARKGSKAVAHAAQTKMKDIFKP